MSKEMSTKEAIEIVNNFKNEDYNCKYALVEVKQAIGIILVDREERCKDYNELVNKIYNKIDYFDMRFENAKKRNDTEKANFYWDLIRNFKKLLEENEVE